MKFILLIAIGVLSFGLLFSAKKTPAPYQRASIGMNNLNDTTPSKKTWDTVHKVYDTARKKRDTLRSY